MTPSRIAMSVAVLALLSGSAFAQNNMPADQQDQAPAATEAPAAPDAGGPSTPDQPADQNTASPLTDDAPAEKMANDSIGSGEMDYASNMGPEHVLASRLTGVTVVNAAGEELGDINDIVLDQSGQPALVVVGVGGFLGIAEKNVAVPFERVTFAMNDENERVAQLDADKATLEAAPRFVASDAGETTGQTN